MAKRSGPSDKRQPPPKKKSSSRVSRTQPERPGPTGPSPSEEALRESEEKYRTVVNSANDGIAIIQDEIVQFANPRLAIMGGYNQDEIVGRPFMEFLSSHEAPALQNFYAARVAGKAAPSKYELQLHKKNGLPIFVEVNSSLIPYRNKPAVLVIIRDATERRRADKLKDSLFRISAAALSSDTQEDFFQSIHRVIADLMPAKNFYIALYDQSAALLSFPYFVDEIDQPDAPRKPGRGLTEYVLRTGKALLASPEVFAQLQRDGEVELVGAPSIDWLGVPLMIDGLTIGVLVVQTYEEGVRYGEEEMDILKFVSDQVAMTIHRKRAEAQIKAQLQEKDVLLKEVHHRVKNNMQVISSLLNLQSRRVLDPAVLEMFRESQRRIRSMALIHERLYQSSDLSHIEFSQYLRNLAIHLFHSYQADSRRIQLRIEAERILLNINTAIPCGLIVNELISNALKHGFPDGRKGELEIRFHKVAQDGFLLRIRDNGVGIPQALDIHKTDTLGMQIVNTLVGQIDGRLELDRRHGTAFELRFSEVAPKRSS
jgi:PAS domain S-box-containing protein